MNIKLRFQGENYGQTKWHERVWPALRWVLLGALTVGLIVFVVSLILYPDNFETSGLNKPLWDWLDLLIIPAMLALGAWWVNHISQRNEQRRADRENQIEREIASERNQEAALQNYLDRMTDLLLSEGLRTSEPGAEVRKVARTRTLTILRGLDPERKTAVVRLLLEADLISVDEEQAGDTEPIISLQGADLTGAILTGANLTGAYLFGANLTEAYLYSVNLTKAFLYQVFLPGAHLHGANLTGANLTGANLTGAFLDGANLTGAELWAATLNGAILPDGSTWTPGTNMSKFTDPESDEVSQT